MANTGQRKSAKPTTRRKSTDQNSPNVFGKYEALEELPSHGFVRIFRGHDRIIQRDVLLKVFQIEPESSPASQDFVRDVRATLSLRHPNIVSLYDFETRDGFAYLAAELLDGETLRDFLGRRGHRTLESKLQFMMEVCDGLTSAHENGVIHHDIRPENIFVLQSGKPKILDFIIAQALRPLCLPDPYDLTTSDYMSPEQFRKQRGDARSDVFSAAVVFFEFLTYSLPFSDVEMGRNDQVRMAALLKKFDPAIPRQLVRVIARGLSPDPAERIQSASDFAAELRGIATELPRLSAELAEEAFSLKEKIIELRENLDTGSPQVHAQLAEIDFSMLDRLAPWHAASIASELDYFSIVELQKQCHLALSSLEKIFAETFTPSAAPLPEMQFLFSEAAEKPSVRGKVAVAEEKLSQIDFATKSRDASALLALKNDLDRLKQKWFEEYTINAAEVESLEATCRKALEDAIEITRVEIQSAISRGDIAAAEEHLKIIERACSGEADYSELATLIREQVQNAANRSERGELKTRQPEVELITEPAGRICTGCKHSNPMEAVVCESCGLRLPGTRHLTPALEEPAPRIRRAVQLQPAEIATEKRSYGPWIAIGGAVVLILVISAILLVLRSPKVPMNLPVAGSAVIARDAMLRTSPGSDATATAIGRGEAIELLGGLPDLKPDAWVDVRVKSDGRRGVVGLMDVESIHTDNCAFDLWHAALLMPGNGDTDAAPKLERLGRVEAEMRRCPRSATDDLRMTMAESYTRAASVLPWKSAQNDIREAKIHLANIQNPTSYAGRMEALNATLDGLAPAPVPAPAAKPAKASLPSPETENVTVAENILKQSKVDLENAETRVQLNAVIANMNAISNMSLNGKRGLEIQKEAKKVRDKAANSLGLVK